MDNNIEKYINFFINSTTDTKYSEIHRFNSWDICFNKFKTIFTSYDIIENNDDIIDNLALNLGMYLSSWGMMRGSTNLLQHSYKIHKPIISELFTFYKENIFIYNEFNADYLEYLKSKTLDIFNITKTIFETYKKSANQVARFPKEQWSQITYDTLTTKILLGTLGITPPMMNFSKKVL